MICTNCLKLAYLKSNKACIRCQGNVLINIGILCEFCSNSEKKCAVCAKSIILNSERQLKKGCNCGSK